MISPQESNQYDFNYNDNEFHKFCELIYKHTGITMDANKRDLVYSRITRRIRDLQLNSFTDYRSIVEAGEDANELEEFVNVVTTNLTSFFRQDYHFEYLTKIIQGYVVEGKNRIRIWSSAASTGEEPYSIAYTVARAIPDLSRVDVKILATDIDSDVLETAAQGVYSLDKIQNVPAHFLQNAFHKGVGAHEGEVKIKSEYQDLISFRRLNLMHDWPMHGPFDIIFCRNVIIYFNKAVQKELFSRYAMLQKAGDYMMIGHSENLFKVSDEYKLLEKAIYKRV